MGWFGFGKEREVIDLSERYRKMKEQSAQAQAGSEEKKEEKLEAPTAKGFGFLANLAAKAQEKEQNSAPTPESAEEKKKRLAKRLTDMSNKIEELTSQIYHLQQRVEVLERKAGVSGFE